MTTQIELEDYLKKVAHGGFKSFLKRALELGVKITLFPEAPTLIKLTYKGAVVFCTKGNVPIVRRAGRFTVDKNLTKTFLNDLGISTPRGIIANTLEEAVSSAKKHNLKQPLILKPIDGSLAKGVTWNIRSAGELKKAVAYFKKLQKKHKFKSFLLEEMYLGREYRILVFKGKVLSCIEKIPATVIGDGTSTIQELIDKNNETRLEGFKIKIDRTARQTILKNNLKLTSVLPKKTALKLRDNLNISDGGRAVDCTHEMSSYLKKICEQSIQAIGFTYGGIDLLTNNIATTQKNGYTILEINSNPYFNMHEKPLVEGKYLDVSALILKDLFPNLNLVCQKK